MPIQKKSKVRLGPEARGQENGEEVYLATPRLWGLGDRCEHFQWGLGRSSGRKRFYCNLNSVNGLC